MTTPAVDLKTQGQDLSLTLLTEQHWAAFTAILAGAPHYFSINQCRAALDDAGIPASQRGGLFNRAIRARLIWPRTVSGYAVWEPSTGRSARASNVRVYVRMNYPEGTS